MKQKTKNTRVGPKKQTGMHVHTSLRAGDYDECRRGCRRAGGSESYCDPYCKNFWPK